MQNSSLGGGTRQRGSDGMLDGPINSSGYTGCYHLSGLDAPEEMLHAYAQYVQTLNYRRATSPGLACDKPGPRPFDAVWRDLYRRALAEQNGEVDEPTEVSVVEELGREDAEVVLEGAPFVPDTLTIAGCPITHRAHKRYFHDPEAGELLSDGYDVGELITSQAVEVTSLAKLRDLLVWLEGQPTRWVMRGDVREDVKASKPHRRIYRDDHDSRACYRAADRRWVLIDVDQVEWPRGVEPGDGEAVARFMLEQLPACFQGAGCVWHFSNSAGFDGWKKVKMHLWFWLDRPVCGYSWREWVKLNAPIVDTAPYNPVQPHYTASPSFDGVADPLAGMPRTGLIPGGVVTVPSDLVDLATHSKQTELLEQRRADARQRARAARSSRGQARGYAIGALRRACENIRAAAEGDRHETIRAESLATSRFVAGGEIDEATWRDEIKRAAIEVLPSSRWKEVDRLLDGAVRIEGVA